MPTVSPAQHRLMEAAERRLSRHGAGHRAVAPGNPTIALLECGTSTTCAAPTTIGSVQITAAGTATPATVASAAITAGDYVAAEITAGTCAASDVYITAQAHSN